MQAPPSYSEAIALPGIPHMDPSMSPARPPDYTRFAPIPLPPPTPSTRSLTPPLPSPVRIDITRSPSTYTPPTRSNEGADRSNKDYSDWKLMCKCLGYTILFLLIIAGSIIEIITEDDY